LLKTTLDGEIGAARPRITSLHFDIDGALKTVHLGPHDLPKRVRVAVAAGQMLQKLVNRAQGQRAVGGVQQWVHDIGLAVALGVVYFLAAQLGLSS
jgi:hypothetical protein